MNTIIFHVVKDPQILNINLLNSFWGKQLTIYYRSPPACTEV